MPPFISRRRLVCRQAKRAETAAQALLVGDFAELTAAPVFYAPSKGATGCLSRSRESYYVTQSGEVPKSFEAANVCGHCRDCREEKALVFLRDIVTATAGDSDLRRYRVGFYALDKESIGYQSGADLEELAAIELELVEIIHESMLLECDRSKLSAAITRPTAVHKKRFAARFTRDIDDTHGGCVLLLDQVALRVALDYLGAKAAAGICGRLSLVEVSTLPESRKSPPEPPVGGITFEGPGARRRLLELLRQLLCLDWDAPAGCASLSTYGSWDRNERKPEKRDGGPPDIKFGSRLQTAGVKEFKRIVAASELDHFADVAELQARINLSADAIPQQIAYAGKLFALRAYEAGLSALEVEPDQWQDTYAQIDGFYSAKVVGAYAAACSEAEVLGIDLPPMPIWDANPPSTPRMWRSFYSQPGDGPNGECGVPSIRTDYIDRTPHSAINGTLDPPIEKTPHSTLTLAQPIPAGQVRR